MLGANMLLSNLEDVKNAYSFALHVKATEVLANLISFDLSIYATMN